MTDVPAQHRFLTPTQAAEELNVKPNPIHVLIKTGELRAIQIGGRGMWRIGREDIEGLHRRGLSAHRSTRCRRGDH